MPIYHTNNCFNTSATSNIYTNPTDMGFVPIHFLEHWHHQWIQDSTFIALVVTVPRGVDVSKTLFNNNAYNLYSDQQDTNIGDDRATFG